MPIKGWTETNQTRLPRLGSIALGVKGERGNPIATDYFVLPDEIQKACEELKGITQEEEQLHKEMQDAVAWYQNLTEEEQDEKVEEFTQKRDNIKTRYNAIKECKKIRELDVVLPGESIEEIMPAWLKRYGKQFGLICRGDGETASVNARYAAQNPHEYGLQYKDGIFINQDGEKCEVIDSGGKKWVQVQCTYKDCPHYGPKCKEVAILSVILYRMPGVLGVYSLDTGSFNSYQNVKNSIEMLRAMLGRVSFIPLKLKVKMQEVNPEIIQDGQKKQIKKDVPILYLDMGDYTLENVIQMAKEQKLTAQTLALPQAQPDVEVQEPNEESIPELLYPEEVKASGQEPTETPSHETGEPVPEQSKTTPETGEQESQTPSNKKPFDTSPAEPPRENIYTVKNAKTDKSPKGTSFVRLALTQGEKVLEAALPGHDDANSLIGKTVAVDLSKQGQIIIASNLQIIENQEIAS